MQKHNGFAFSVKKNVCTGSAGELYVQVRNIFNWSEKSETWKKYTDISNEQTNQNDNPDPNSKPNNQQSVFRRWPLSVPFQLEKYWNLHSLVIVIRRVTDLSCEKTDAKGLRASVYNDVKNVCMCVCVCMCIYIYNMIYVWTTVTTKSPKWWEKKDIAFDFCRT